MVLVEKWHYMEKHLYLYIGQKLLNVNALYQMSNFERSKERTQDSIQLAPPPTKR